MMKLEDYMPTPDEREMTGDMPEQVAIGFIRARRRHQMSKSKARHKYGKNHYK